MNNSEIINELGEDRENYKNAVTPPIFQTSNFAFPSVSEMRKGFENEFEIPVYTRCSNPTIAILRKKIAALEHTEDALVLGSGMAAISTAIISSVKSGDHVICVKKPYSWASNLFNTILKRFDVETTFIDGTKIENFETAIQKNTTLIYLESPNSLTFELQDLEAAAKIAKSKNITTICDNSYSSPLFQNPTDFGIDLVVHSATKYINGHSDVVAGVICGKKTIIEKIMEEEFATLGGIISPNDAWLMIRGLRTLPVRMKYISESAEKVVAFLESHPKIEKVIYPFSKNFPQYELAKKQMSSCGSLFSIILKTKDFKSVELFSNALKHFLMACSWGGHESLQVPTCAICNEEEAKQAGLPFNLIRLYVGLDDTETLIADLKQALDKI